MPNEDKLKEKVKGVLAEVIDEAVEEEVAERRPGMKIRGQKIPWSRRDVEEAFPPVTFIPDETIRVTWNGIVYQLIADQEVTVPSCIKTVYDDSKLRRRQSARGVRTDYGYSPVIGVGPLDRET